MSRPDSGPAEPAALDETRLRNLLTAGVTVLDSRGPARFDAGHLAGAVNLPLSSPGVGTRAGWAFDPTEPLLIVADDAGSARATASSLQAVGFWDLPGYCVADHEAWEHACLPVARADSWDLDRLAERTALRFGRARRRPRAQRVGRRSRSGLPPCPPQPPARGVALADPRQRPHDRRRLRRRRARRVRRQPPATRRAATTSSESPTAASATSGPAGSSSPRATDRRPRSRAWLARAPATPGETSGISRGSAAARGCAATRQPPGAACCKTGDGVDKAFLIHDAYTGKCGHAG